jgi:hypothetical protein
LPVDEIKESWEDEENDDGEGEDNTLDAQSPWTLLQTALPVL